MKKGLLRLAVHIIALYAAIALMNGRGINAQSDDWVSLFWLALIFGVINAVLKPLLKILTCPLIILTLGLGTLLINTLLFYLAGMIGVRFGVGFTVDNFWAAFLGALIVSVISFLFSILLKDDNKKKK